MSETRTVDTSPCARWTSDCNGKQDYDGRMLSISTRYWPAWKSSDRRPSAHAAIHVNHGRPDPDDDWGDYTVLFDQEFSAATESEVKVLVEAWVAEQFAYILGRLEVILTGAP